jgi:hypothetical protein
MMFGPATPSRHLGIPRDGGLGWTPVFREDHCRAHVRSEARSQDLLRQWLSPDQAEQYDKYQRFDVVGSDTGKRYRIRRGAAMNIEELAADGYVTRRWCFAPEGASAIGDVMLAQKIALETFELEALAIANHDGRQGAGLLGGSFLHIGALEWQVLTFACFVTLVWLFLQIVF